jgi:hypothetical protein
LDLGFWMEDAGHMSGVFDSGNPSN